MEHRPDDIVIQTETPGAPSTMFRLAIGGKVFAEHLTGMEAADLVMEIIVRLGQPRLARRRAALLGFGADQKPLRLPLRLPPATQIKTRRARS